MPDIEDIADTQRHINPAWKQAGDKTKPKRIALFGGSFNPPHDGHFKLMENVAQNLGVDEIWMIFSHNRFKNENDYADLPDRLEMSRILSNHYPDLPVVFSDVEQRIGTNITADILRTLQAEEPDTEFVWVMGSDNLEQFHKWEDYEFIMENFEISVINRPDFDQADQQSETAQKYMQYRKEPDEKLDGPIKGWSYMRMDIDLSSSNLLKDLRAGITKFAGGFQDVADYIIRRGLYGVAINPAHKTQPK